MRIPCENGQILILKILKKVHVPPPLLTKGEGAKKCKRSHTVCVSIYLSCDCMCPYVCLCDCMCLSVCLISLFATGSRHVRKERRAVG